MKVTRFEELEIWTDARELYKEVFLLTSKEPFCNDFRFRDQIRAASGSVSNNIAEGFERGGNKEFFQFLSIAKGSCGEVRSQVYRSFDSKYIDSQEYHKLIERTESLSRKISSLINYIKSSSLKGSKYSPPLKPTP